MKNYEKKIFESDDYLPLKITLEIRQVVVVIRSVFNDVLLVGITSITWISAYTN